MASQSEHGSVLVLQLAAPANRTAAGLYTIFHRLAPTGTNTTSPRVRGVRSARDSVNCAPASATDSGHTRKVPQLNEQAAPLGPWGRWTGWWDGSVAGVQVAVGKAAPINKTGP